MFISNRFNIIRLIGEGISSHVYEALDKNEKRVALKILKPHLISDELSVLRFKKEIEITQGLDHPGIVKIWELFEENGQLGLVMEYIEGINLYDQLKLEKIFSLSDFTLIFKQLLGIFRYCHSRGIIHRDIKTLNIFVNLGQVTVIDFGISKITAVSDLTHAGTTLGTPEYMAPELFAASHYDPRSDIYALGVVAYEILAGHLPFQAENLVLLYEKKIQSVPKSIRSFHSEVPEWLEKIISKMLESSPLDRYQTIAEIEFDFQSEHFFELPKGHFQETLCLKCYGKTPILFSTCLCCGFSLLDHQEKDPKKVKHKTKELWVSPSSPKQKTREYLKWIGSPIRSPTIFKWGRLLFNNVPASMASLIKFQAKKMGVILDETEISFQVWLKQNFMFLISGVLLNLILFFAVESILNEGVIPSRYPSRWIFIGCYVYWVKKLFTVLKKPFPLESFKNSIGFLFYGTTLHLLAFFVVSEIYSKAKLASQQMYYAETGSNSMQGIFLEGFLYALKNFFKTWVIGTYPMGLFIAFGYIAFGFVWMVRLYNMLRVPLISDWKKSFFNENNDLSPIEKGLQKIRYLSQKETRDWAKKIIINFLTLWGKSFKGRTELLKQLVPLVNSSIEMICVLDLIKKQLEEKTLLVNSTGMDRGQDLLRLEDMQMRVVQNLILMDSTISRVIYEFQDENAVSTKISFDSLISESKEIRNVFESTSELQHLSRTA